MFTDTRTLKNWLKESIDLNKASRELARKSLEYKEGEQLADDIKVTVSSRGQAEQWENNIEKFDTRIYGYQESMESTINIIGRQGKDKADARIIKNTIRAISDENEQIIEEEASQEDLRHAGVAIQEIKVKQSDEKDMFGRTLKDVYIVNLPSSECFLDPHSKKEDYSDARHFTQAFFVTEEEFYALGFDEKDIEKLTTNNYVDSSLDEDVSESKRFLLCYSWYVKYDKKLKKNRNYYCYWCDNIILKQEVSPFEHLIDTFPIIVQFLRKKRNRTKKIRGYAGIYKNVLPLQDAINQAKLRLHNMLGNVKVLVQTDAVDDIVIFKDEYSEDNAIVEVDNINGIKEIKQHTEYQQIMNIIVDTRVQLKELIGFNDELLALSTNRLSGVAMDKRMKNGSFGLSYYFTACKRLKERTLKKMIPFITYYYDATRIVKIVDGEDIEYITINEPALDMNGQMSYEEVGDGFVKPKMYNTIETGKYDLIFNEEPKEVSSANESLRLNIDLLGKIQKIAPAIALELAPEVYTDHEAPIATKLKAILEHQKNSSNDMNQEQQLKIAKMMSEIKVNESKALYQENKTNVDLLRIEEQSKHNNNINETKQGQTLLNSMRGL